MAWTPLLVNLGLIVQKPIGNPGYNFCDVKVFFTLRWFDTVFRGPYLRFLNDFLVDFPSSNRREIFTTYWV